MLRLPASLDTKEKAALFARDLRRRIDPARPHSRKRQKRAAVAAADAVNRVVRRRMKSRTRAATTSRDTAAKIAA